VPFAAPNREDGIDSIKFDIWVSSLTVTARCIGLCISSYYGYKLVSKENPPVKSTDGLKRMTRVLPEPRPIAGPTPDIHRHALKHQVSAQLR
jgi:hypothetical protein